MTNSVAEAPCSLQHWAGPRLWTTCVVFTVSVVLLCGVWKRPAAGEEVIWQAGWRRDDQAGGVVGE